MILVNGLPELSVKIFREVILQMNGFITNIEKASIDNKAFRKVLYTGQHTQLVLMNLQPNEEIGLEIHPVTDQFLRIEQGMGKVVIDGQEHSVSDGDAIIVPA